MEALLIGFVYFLIANICKALICSRYHFEYRYNCWYIQATANLIVSGFFLTIVFIAEHGVSINEPVHRLFVIYLGVSGALVVVLIFYHLFRLLKKNFYRSTKSRIAIFAIILLIIFGIQSTRFHIETYEAISDACYNAHYSLTLEGRKASLQEGYAYSNKTGLFLPAALWDNPIEVCDEVQTNLINMLEQGICAEWLLRDVPCQCGKTNWQTDNSNNMCGKKRGFCGNNYGTEDYKIECKSLYRW